MLKRIPNANFFRGYSSQRIVTPQLQDIVS